MTEGAADAASEFDAVRFSEIFELAADVAEGIEKIREFVLALAFDGRLVGGVGDAGRAAQDLVARMRQNVAAQRKSRRSSSIDATGVTHLLPSHWARAPLGEIAAILADGSHNPPRDVGAEGIPMLSGQNVRDGWISFDASRYVSEDDYAVERKRVDPRPGDVLLSIVGSIGRSAVVPSGCRRFVLQRSAALVRTDLVPAYLSYFLRSRRAKQYYLEHAKGTAQLGIYLGQLAMLEVPVPPIAEQKRIVAKVDQLMALCDDLEARQTKKRDTSARLTKSALQALTTAEGPEEFDLAWNRVVENFDVLIDRSDKVSELRATVLRLACSGALAARVAAEGDASETMARLRSATGKVVRRGVPERVEPSAVVAAWKLPAHWVAASVADLLRVGELVDVKDGNHGANHPLAAEYVSDGAPFIMASNVRAEIDYEGAKKLPPKVVSRLRVGFAKPGDVIFTHKGTVGRVAMNTRECVLTPQTTYYRVRRPATLLDPEFLCLLLKSPSHQEQLAEVQEQTTRDFVPVSRQYTAFLPLPPLGEQQRIVSRVRLLTGLCDELEARLTRADERASQLVEAVVQELVA